MAVRLPPFMPATVALRGRCRQRALAALTCRKLVHDGAAAYASAGNMDLILISARGEGREPHWSQAIAGAVATATAATGARVRWLCPVALDQPAPAAIDGVDVVLLRGRRPPFRRVIARVNDRAVDIALAHALRPLSRAVVAHIGFGAPGSVTTLWLADRMGANVLSAVRASEVLCHRGTLVDWTGAPCAEFLDPGRCARCACNAWPSGLSPLQARLARWLRPLGDRMPFPNATAFRSRADMVLSSLQIGTVAVATTAERDLLVAAGIGVRGLRVVGPAAESGPDPAALTAAIVASAQVVGSA
jgi:hypothetical protein